MDMRRRQRRRTEEDMRAEQLVDVLIRGAMMGQFSVKDMEERVLTDARRLGRLIADGAATEEYQMAAMELDFAAKLLVLADARQATIGDEKRETS